MKVARISKLQGSARCRPRCPERWLVWGQVLLALLGALWASVLVPAQIRQGRQTRAFAESGEIPASYWREGRRWAVWGVVATMLLLVAIGVMVAKPI